MNFHEIGKMESLGCEVRMITFWKPRKVREEISMIWSKFGS